MIKVVIIDDEPLAREIIKEFLISYKNIVLKAECNDGFEGIKAINQYKPDLIFLDIKMPKISGFEMLEILDSPPLVIFTTAYDEFAVKAFEANAIDYLLKPFDKERFDKSIEKFTINVKSKEKSNQSTKINEIINNYPINKEEQNRVVVKTRKGIKIINISEIYYFEAFDDYVKIHTGDECFLKKKTMRFYEINLETLDFVRVHRSFILSLNKITKIENPEKDVHVAVLKNNIKIPLSRQGFLKLKNILGV